MIRFAAPLVLVCACSSVDDSGPALWLDKSEVHVDASHPDALATPDIVLDFYGGDTAHYIRIDGVWMYTPEASIPLALDLEQTPLLAPAYASLRLPLVNKDLHNSKLADLCQSQLPLEIYVGFPGHPDMTQVAMANLVVFCP